MSVAGLFLPCVTCAFSRLKLRGILCALCVRTLCPLCYPPFCLEFWEISGSARSEDGVDIVADFTPAEFRQRMTRKERGFDRRETNADTDLAAAFRQRARDEKFVVAESTVGDTQLVPRRAEFIGRRGKDAGVAASEEPDAS